MKIFLVYMMTLVVFALEKVLDALLDVVENVLLSNDTVTDKGVIQVLIGSLEPVLALVNIPEAQNVIQMVQELLTQVIRIVVGAIRTLLAIPDAVQGLPMMAIDLSAGHKLRS
ncbi:hypothetical protein Ddc_15538 [Ditylenchus destructor]|nr:hypothetical protein Ddc_15538 [Ditylenchus destructor]